MTDCVDGVETVGSVKVGMTRGRGRGLFATRAMTKGDIVLVERCARTSICIDNNSSMTIQTCSLAQDCYTEDMR